MHTWRTIVALGLLLLLSHQAQAVNYGRLSAASLSLNDGTITGDLAGLSIETSQAIDLSSLNIQGQLDGVVYADETTVVVGGGGITQPSQSQEPIHYDNASLSATASDAGVLLVIRPIQASIAGQISAEFVPEQQGRQYHSSIVAQPDFEVPTSGSLQAKPLAGHLEISGTFELLVYAAHLTIRSENGERSYATGLEVRPYGTSIPGTRGAESTTEREAHITATNGKLTLDLNSAWTVNIKSLVARAGNGALILNEAHGQLLSESLSASQVIATGSVQFNASIDGSRLLGTLTGQANSISVDGTNVAVPTGAPRFNYAWWLALLPILFAAYVVYRAATKRGLLSMEAMLERGEYEAAISRATKLMWLPRTSEDAVVVQAVSWLKLGRVDKAKAAIETKPRGRDRVRPARLYIKARIAGAEGNLQQAKQYLLDCLILAPNYLLEALSDPVLGPLVKDVQSDLAGGYA